MTAVEQWDVDKTQYFDDKRKEPKKPASVPQVPKPAAKPQQAPKTQPAPKPKETQKVKKQEAMDAAWGPMKPNPIYILASCLGVAIFHGILQTLGIYMFVVGALDAQGIIVGTMANALICGFRICWRFKQ